MKINELFVSDTFRTMGDLVDQDKWYAGRDKVQHVAIAMLLYLLLPFSFIINFSLIFILGWLWEGFEYLRYRKYGYSRMLCDKMSWRDVVANMIGALLGALLRVIN